MVEQGSDRLFAWFVVIFASFEHGDQIFYRFVDVVLVARHVPQGLTARSADVHVVMEQVGAQLGHAAKKK